MTDEPTCSEDCIARRPLGSDAHIPSCPCSDKKGTGGTVLVFRNEAERPVAVPEDVVEEAERDYRAYKLWRQGLDWEEIAEREGYPTSDAAAATVKRYLDEGRAIMYELTRREIIADHVSRLRTYRAAMWDAGVIERKPAAMSQLLAIEDRWVKAFGLDQPDAEDNGVQTVVVPSAEYLEWLQKVATDPAVKPSADAG